MFIWKMKKSSKLLGTTKKVDAAHSSTGARQPKNDLVSPVKSDPTAKWAMVISICALLVSILALVPGYHAYIKGPQIFYTFTCQTVDYSSPAGIREGPPYYDFAEIGTRCEFKNTGSSTISILSTEQYGLARRHELHKSFGKFSAVRKEFPTAVLPGHAFVFDDYYLVPIAKDWRNSNPACAKLGGRNRSTLIDVLSCLEKIRDFREYIANVSFPGATGGEEVYESFALQIELIDGTRVQEEMKLSQTIRNDPFRARIHTK